jgi:PEGA domain-containing protein
MRSRKLGVAVILALAVATVPASPVSARSSHPGSLVGTRASQASQDITPPETVSPGGRVATGEKAEGREAFIVSPGILGPAFSDPFWYGPAWGWFGPGPIWTGALVTQESVPPNMARLSLHVRPHKADLVIDGTDVGEARDYTADTRPLWLSPGSHQVEIRYSGYRTLRLGLEVSKGQVYDLHYRLDPGQGIDSRSTEGGARAQVNSHQPVSS